MMRRTALWFLVAVLMLGSLSASAQSSELLTNPGLEEGSFGPYTTRRGGDFPIYLPNGWNVWLAGPTGEFLNRSDRTTINPHPGPGPSPREGTRAVNIDCGFVTCTAAIYQQAAVQPDTNIQASAWAQVKACNLAPDQTSCASAVESGAQTRIGIDPNGGSDPNDSDIVWSGWVQPHDQWLQMTVSATTSGASATVFLYSTQGSTAQLNRTYWDQVSVTGGGAGGAAAAATTPVPTAPPEAPFVVAQNERPDGSIVHTVQEGDTLDSIAVAYGLTRQDLLELNNINDPRIIQIGQEILVRSPLPTSGASFTETLPESTAEAGAASTTDPQAEEGGSGAPASLPTIQPTTQVSADVPTPPLFEAAQQSPAAPVVAVGQANALPANEFTSLEASVCVLLFDDVNQNRIQEQGELLLAGGTINLNSEADLTGTVETDGVSEPQCFNSLAAGPYILTASAPTGYGFTSPEQLKLDVEPGSKLEIAFGAAQGVAPVAPLPAEAGGIPSETRAQETDTRSTLDQLFDISGLLVFGLAGIVLVVGMGMTVLLRRR